MRAGKPGTAARRAGGFTYFIVLNLIAVTGIGAAALGTMWHTAAQREKERELLAIGGEFRRAIGAFYAVAVEGRRQYPRSLDDLLRDQRFPGVRRYLRRIYVDPVTNNDEWGLVRAPDGGIMGVYSLSDARPLKTGAFSTVDRDFEGAEHYSDWQFVVRVAHGPLSPPGWKTEPQRRR